MSASVFGWGKTPDITFTDNFTENNIGSRQDFVKFFLLFLGEMNRRNYTQLTTFTPLEFSP